MTRTVMGEIEIRGRRFKDGQDVTHLVLAGSKNRNVGGVDIKTACGLQYNVIPDISLRKYGDVDCMGCLVKVR